MRGTLKRREGGGRKEERERGTERGEEKMGERKRMGKRHETCLTKDDIRMPSNFITRCSVSLAIRGMLI